MVADDPMGQPTSRRTPTGGVRRRWALASAILIAMLASASFGYLVRERRLFPYKLAKHARAQMTPSTVAPEATQSPSGNRGRMRSRRPRSPGVPLSRSTRSTGSRIFPTSRVTVRQTQASDPRPRPGSLPGWFEFLHVAARAGRHFDGHERPGREDLDGECGQGVSRLSPHEDPRGGRSFFATRSYLPDGGIVGLFDELGIVRLDVSSRLALGMARSNTPRHRCRCVGQRVGHSSREPSRRSVSRRRARLGRLSR